LLSTWQYNIQGRSTDSAAVNAPADAWTDQLLEEDEYQWIWFVKAVLDGSSTQSPHGNTLLAGSFVDQKGSRSLPMTKDNIIQFHGTFTGGGGAGHCTIQMWKFEDNRATLVQQQQVSLVTPGAFAVTFVADFTGDYAFKRVPVGISAPVLFNYTDCFLAQGAAEGTWGVRHAPNIDAKFMSMDRVATQSAMIVLSNTTKILEKEGWVRMARIDGGRHWRQYIASVSATFNDIADQCPKGARKGGSIVLKPEEEFWANPKDYFATQEGIGLIDSYYPVATNLPFYVIGITMPDIESRTFQISTFCGLVYDTMDSFVETKEPWATAREWDEALEVIGRLREFYANDTHASEIEKGINNVMKTINSVSELGSMVSSVFG